jgi:hypothetical protein
MAWKAWHNKGWLVSIASDDARRKWLVDGAEDAPYCRHTLPYIIFTIEAKLNKFLPLLT